MVLGNSDEVETGTASSPPILTGAIAFKSFSEFSLAIHAVDSTNRLSIKLAITHQQYSR